jgi:hypothetical protein
MLIGKVSSFVSSSRSLSSSPPRLLPSTYISLSRALAPSSVVPPHPPENPAPSLSSSPRGREGTRFYRIPMYRLRERTCVEYSRGLVGTLEWAHLRDAYARSFGCKKDQTGAPFFRQRRQPYISSALEYLCGGPSDAAPPSSSRQFANSLVLR